MRILKQSTLITVHVFCIIHIFNIFFAHILCIYLFSIYFLNILVLAGLRVIGFSILGVMLVNIVF